MKQVQLRFSRNIGAGVTQDNFSLWQPVVNKAIEIISIAAFADLVNTTTQGRSRMFGFVQLLQDNINIDAFGDFAPLGAGISLQTDNILYAFGHGDYSFMQVPVRLAAGSNLVVNVSLLAEIIPANNSVETGAVSFLYRELEGSEYKKDVSAFDFSDLKRLKNKPFGSLE